MRDAWRLAVGTLTILPVRPPGHVDRRTGGRAMVLAPVVGLLLGVVVVTVLWLVGGRSAVFMPGGPDVTYVGTAESLPGSSSPTPLLAATLAVAMVALLTRGLHLDGLADTADGLGSGKPPDQALEVMRRSDVGPFGVAAVVLLLLVQVAAVESLLSGGVGLSGVVVALVVSRLSLPVVCSRGVRAARPDGLGSAVAGSVSRAQLLVSCVLALLAVGLVVAWPLDWHLDRPLGWPLDWPLGWPLDWGTSVLVSGEASTGSQLPGLVVAVLLPLVAAGALAWRCVRRLGGVTGDVLGACVELSFTTCLVILALA